MEARSCVECVDPLSPDTRPRRWFNGGRREEVIMQIVVYGAGYLGTVLSACLADFGTPIVCCDSDERQVSQLAQGHVAFYEKGRGWR